jgi:hypothetical protein
MYSRKVDQSPVASEIDRTPARSSETSSDSRSSSPQTADRNISVQKAFVDRSRPVRERHEPVFVASQDSVKVVEPPNILKHA